VLIHPTPGSVFRIDWQVPDDVDLDEEECCGTLDQRIRAIIGPHRRQRLHATLRLCPPDHAGSPL
jgi:hypothetical protein